MSKKNGVYNDLGKEKLDGTANVGMANNNSYINIPIHPDGLAALNAARGGTIAFGGSPLDMNTSSYTNELAFTGG